LSRRHGGTAAAAPARLGNKANEATLVPGKTLSFDTIGETVVVNPGCDHAGPHLVFMDLEDLSRMEHSVYGRQGRR
jgi:hypothetical protein